jgi:hypothetical protein
MPFAPDSLVTSQNPPDFRWPQVAGAKQYHLQVSRDAAVSTVVHSNAAITNNFYNFPDVFGAGTWYWRVQYQDQSNQWSDWSAIRSFRIEEQNVPFPVPPVGDLMSEIGMAHPRIWTNPDTLNDFRAKAQTVGKAVYDSTYNWYTNSNNYNPLTSYDNPTSSTPDLRRYVNNATDSVLKLAFLYLVTGDSAYSDLAVPRLVKLASWDPNGVTGYTSNDQYHRSIALHSAIAFDWLYDRISATDKTTVKNMIQTRTQTMVGSLVGPQATHSIMKNPFDSHGWTAFGFIGIIATAMLHDLPDAAEWFEQVVPAYINILPPWGGEDGGWTQGTGYWRWSSMANKEFMDVLLEATGFSLYDKAFSRNEGLYPLYAWPAGSPKGIFGDESHYSPDGSNDPDAPGGASVNTLTRLAQLLEDPLMKPRMKWAADTVGVGLYPDLSNYFYAAPDVTPRPPIDLPDSRWFQDIGLVAMHSKLYDPDRVSLYFRSSPYGSYNHGHADQNSFVINAFGEALAVEAGHYVAYHDAHDKHVNKQTFASNAITYDGKRGQLFDDMNADGEMYGFVTHPDFDAASGDAAKAYMGGLSKAGRHIIYVRPNLFVVVDQLQSADPDGNEFEWRLHAEDDLKLDHDNQGATILKGDAGLKVRVHAPQNLRTEYEDQYLGYGGIEYPPTDKFAGEQQLHAAFITPKTPATTFVSTLEAYKRGSAPQHVTVANNGTYMKLTFADGSIVYVKMTSAVGDIVTDTITFNGTAAALKGNTVLLVDGTKVVKDNATVIQSDLPATVVYGDNQLSVSSKSKVQVSLHMPDRPNIVTVRDFGTDADIPVGGTAVEAMGLRGVYWEMSGPYTLTMQVEKGQRAFKLNAAPATLQPRPAVTLPIDIGGVTSAVTLQTYTDTEGQPVSFGKLNNTEGLYEVLEAPTGLRFDRQGMQPGVYLEENAAVTLRGATGTLKLKRIGTTNKTAAVELPNPDMQRSNLNVVWQEAEKPVGDHGGRYWSKVSDASLSGGFKLSNWMQKGHWVKWSFNVPASGNYDLVLKYSAGWNTWNSPASRYAVIGGQPYYFEACVNQNAQVNTCPATNNWKGLRVQTDTYLEAGPVDITMWATDTPPSLTFNPMDLDWLGLVKRGGDEVRPTIPANVQLASKTDTSATISWTASSDNVAIKEYSLTARNTKDAKDTVVKTSTASPATITGLRAGAAYSVTMKAVDTSENPSLNSATLSVTTNDTQPPVWPAASQVWAERSFPNAARLKWNPATDHSGSVASYSIYRKGPTETVYTKIGTAVSSGLGFDAIGLQPNSAYSFKVQAADALGNESGTGPVLNLTTPAAAVGGEYYETFDAMATGNLLSGNGWTVTKNNGGTVTIDTNAVGNNVLKVDDTYQPDTTNSTADPIVARSNAALNGKVTFETRFKSTGAAIGNDSNHPVGNYELKLRSGSTDVVRFNGFTGGSFGYISNGGTGIRIPTVYTNKYPEFDLPSNQWVTLRVDVDTVGKTYDITMQADAFKWYSGFIDPLGTLDRAAGVYKITGLPFYNNGTATMIDSFQFTTTRYKSTFLFDYVAMYDNGFAETFDGLPNGGFASGGNWTVSNPNPLSSSSTIVASPDSAASSKSLLLADNQFAHAADYTEAPIVRRTTTPLSGNVTFETRFRSAEIGNLEMTLQGSGTNVMRFDIFGNNTLGYWKQVNGTNTAFKIPATSPTYPLPLNQWMTLRLDLDTVSKTYDLTMQSDAFKAYSGAVDASVLFDPAKGTFAVRDIPFYNGSTATAIESVRIAANLRTSDYYFDYVRMYNR